MPRLEQFRAAYAQAQERARQAERNPVKYGMWAPPSDPDDRAELEASAVHLWAAIQIMRAQVDKSQLKRDYDDRGHEHNWPSRYGRRRTTE